MIQFCGNDPDILLEAGKLVEHQCDGIDLNLGCPQQIARKGFYGSFLLEEFDLLARIVKTMSTNLSVPVSCKIRLLPSLEKTIQLAKLLEANGCALLTVHGRTKEQNKRLVGSSDWNAIQKIKEAISIPVFANGGIGVREDVKRCMDATGVDGVMSSEAILENPGLCIPHEEMPSPTDIALTYLKYARLYPDTVKIVRSHLMKILYGVLEAHPEFRLRFMNHGHGDFIDIYENIIQELVSLHGPCNFPQCTTQQRLSGPWYDRHLKTNKQVYSECKDHPATVHSTERREEILQLREDRKSKRKASKHRHNERKKKMQVEHFSRTIQVTSESNSTVS